MNCTLALILASLFLTELARAQAIFGSVRTVGGVPIEGVLVRATRISPLQVVTGTTDSGGGFVVGAGLSGTYTVQAIESGYSFTPASTNVTISGSSIRVDFTTPATAPTVMTLAAGNIMPDFAVLRFQVRPNGATTLMWFEYGLTASYGNISETRGMGSGTNFSISGVNVDDLLNNTTYHFRAVGSNSFGVRYGADETFTTLQGFPSVITLGASQITPAAARLQGSVNPTGSTTRAWFELGTTTNYGTVTAVQNVGNGNAGTNFNQLVTLVPGTTYHYRAVASNVFGVVYGAATNFTTFSGIPSVITFPPSQLGANTARLNGTVNPNGATATAWFDLGTTTNYGDVAVGQNLGGGTNYTNFSQMLIGLTPGTTYHYRAAAASSFGTNYGTGMHFTPLFTATGTNIPYAGYGSLAWGDYDNDGRLDVVASPLSGVWRNTGGGFALNTNAGLPYAADGSVAWGDYDSDGWLDILLTGWTWPITTTGVARVYHNNRDGTFTDIHAGLPKIHRSSAVWGDYDNDGRQDILLAGLNVNTNPITQVWRNTGFGFALDSNVALPGIHHGAVAWGDYDNDGRLDILLAGSTTGRNPYEPPHESIAQVWRNTGNGFANINAGLPGAAGWNNHSAVAWGDYDNDGRLDILLAGTTNGTFTGVVCQVWRNTGNGFVLNTNAGLTGVVDSSVAWGDYDNDGWLDVLLSGYRRTDFVPITEVWRNTGTGFFNINAGLAGVADGGAVWGDFDNDGRLDILAAAFGGYLWRNNIPTTNTTPGAPSGLTFSFANSAMTLSWNAALDNETPVAGLNYNIRIGTTPGGSDVLSAMASVDGLRRVPQLGNAQQRLSTTLNLPSMSTPYHWSVQAVDGAFAGSPFAAESTFKLLPVLVPVTTTNAIPGDLNGDGIVDQTELNIVLSNYWPHSPWIEMTNVAGLGTTNVQFALTNATGWNFSVEVSTNLMNWDFLGPAFPFYQFFDPAATNDPQRYYRLRWP